MASSDGGADDESEPVPKTSWYLRMANLVVRFVKNVVKLAVMLAS